MNKVQIIPDEKGNVIRQSENPEYGYVRLEQKKSIYSGSWLNVKKISALLHAKIEDFQAIGIKDQTELPGNIVIVESTTPFDSDNPDRDLKIAGKTGIVCCYYGEPIYRKTMYDSTGTLQDELIPHTNGDDIKQANAQNQSSAVNNLFKMNQEQSDFESNDEKPETNQIDLEDSIKEIEAEEQNKKQEVSTDEVEDFVETVEEESNEVIDDFEDDTFEL